MRVAILAGVLVLLVSGAHAQQDETVTEQRASAAVEALSAAEADQTRVGDLFADIPVALLLGESGAGRTTSTMDVLSDISDLRGLLTEHLGVLRDGLDIEGDTPEVRAAIAEAEDLLALYHAQSEELLDRIRTSPYAADLLEQMAQTAAQSEDTGLAALVAAAAQGAAQSAANPEWRLGYSELDDAPAGGLQSALQMVRAQEERCRWLVEEVDRRAPACLVAARGNAHLLVQTLQRRSPGAERDMMLAEARLMRARLDTMREQL